MKTLTLITKGKNTCKALEQQLVELLGDRVLVEAFYLEENINAPIGKDLIIASSPLALELAQGVLNPACPQIVALRSVNDQGLEALLNLPPGTQALIANDTEWATYDTISFLQTIGMTHIEYFPYYPGIPDYPCLKLAITPGESQYVPQGIERVIDIQNRGIDFITLVEILRQLHLLDEKANLLSAKYMSGIINLLIKNNKMAKVNQKMKTQLSTIINTVRDGIIAIDEADHITVFNAIAEDLLSFPQEEAIGKSLLEGGLRSDIQELLTSCRTSQENFKYINGRHLVVNRAEMIEESAETDAPKGNVYTLNDVTEIQRLEEEHRRELVSHQNYARYTFAHILGESDLIQTTKQLAQKIARSDSPILIQGESGTGKELFAQGIHNDSPRKNGPFIAVNFAALSESLLESELFGYEEGAFTGAKKGGMSGLFQQAHKGTIFLDEIGDAPLSFQIKLLRVLQEKQVRRIGSARIIPIDIRVIVATNKNLKELIEQGTFRQDLYYRLNVLPIKLPPLRERKQDILILAKYFYRKYFTSPPIIDGDAYFRNVEEFLLAYNWPGNIRELQNVVEYLVNISPQQPPDEELLPEEVKEGILLAKLAKDVNEPTNTETSPYQDSPISLIHFFHRETSPTQLILERIAHANEQNQTIGRRSLALQVGLTEGVIRGLLEDLEKKGYLIPNRGRKGLVLTVAGMERLLIEKRRD